MNPDTPQGPSFSNCPRITLVTAVYNGENYLEATIRSVIGQGYPNLEYIIVNDGSTDGTVAIIKKYEQHLASWSTQPNRGLYPALNAGFAKGTGEIMGWISANDKLHTGGLLVVGSVFRDLPQVQWITGRPTGYSQGGMTVNLPDLPRWSRWRFLAGANRYIQQESTFWRRRLWEKAGSELSTEFRAEGDFELWVRFFRHARLYSVEALIGGYRAHEDALSSGNIDRYNSTCDLIADRELFSVPDARAVKLFRRLSRTAARIPKVRGLWQRFVMKGLYRFPGPDWPPVIEYRNDKWALRD